MQPVEGAASGGPLDTEMRCSVRLRGGREFVSSARSRVPGTARSPSVRHPGIAVAPTCRMPAGTGRLVCRRSLTNANSRSASAWAASLSTEMPAAGCAVCPGPRSCPCPGQRISAAWTVAGPEGGVGGLRGEIRSTDRRDPGPAVLQSQSFPGTPGRARNPEPPPAMPARGRGLDPASQSRNDGAVTSGCDVGLVSDYRHPQGRPGLEMASKTVIRGKSMTCIAQNL